MKQLKKITALLLALTMMAMAATGCVGSYANKSTEAPTEKPQETTGSSATDAPATDAPATDPAPADLSGVSLDVWYAVSGNSGELFTQMSTQFEKQTGATLKLSYQGSSSETATKVAAAQLNGTAPDVALMYAGPLYTGGKGDFNIDELMNGSLFDKADIFEGMLDYCTYMDDGICAVPFGISTQVLYYNKDLLAKAGVDMSNPPKTWNEFMETLKTVKSTTGAASVFDTNDEAWLFKSMLMQNGCQIVQMDAEGSIEPIFNNEQAVQVADYWYSLITEELMPAGEHTNAENNFLSGKLAFIAASSNRISRWTGETSFGLGAIEMPYFTQPSLALWGNVMVILTKDPEKVQAAWQYICYLTNVENNTAFALNTGYLPIHKSAMEQDIVKKAIEENEMYGVAFKQLEYTWAYTHFEQMGTMDVQIKSMLNKLEKGRGSSQDLLNNAVNTLQKEIDADK